MTTFRYKGQTAGGAKVSGVLRAYDEFEAADKLRESVAIITKLEAVPEKKESVLSRPWPSGSRRKSWRSVLPIRHHSGLRAVGGALRVHGSRPDEEQIPPPDAG